MARYYKYSEQPYNSQFVPLPLDLFAAQAQQKQGQIDKYNENAMLMEDGFRKVKALNVDIDKRNELLDAYIENVNKLYETSNGDVNMMNSGLKAINSQFQEDMARGWLGSINTNYDVYNAYMDRQKKRFDKGEISEEAYRVGVQYGLEAFGGTKDLGDGHYSNIDLEELNKKFDDKDLRATFNMIKDDGRAFKETLGYEVVGGNVSGVARSKASLTGFQFLEDNKDFDKHVYYKFQNQFHGKDVKNIASDYYNSVQDNGLTLEENIFQELENSINLYNNYPANSNIPEYEVQQNRNLLENNINYLAQVSDALEKGDYETAYKLEYKRNEMSKAIDQYVTAVTHDKKSITSMVTSVAGQKAVAEHAANVEYNLKHPLTDVLNTNIKNADSASIASALSAWFQKGKNATTQGLNELKTLMENTGINAIKTFTNIFVDKQKEKPNASFIEIVADISLDLLSTEDDDEFKKKAGLPENISSQDVKAVRNSIGSSYTNLMIGQMVDNQIEAATNEAYYNKQGGIKYDKLMNSNNEQLREIAYDRKSLHNKLYGGNASSWNEYFNQMDPKLEQILIKKAQAIGAPLEITNEKQKKLSGNYFTPSIDYDNLTDEQRFQIFNVAEEYFESKLKNETKANPAYLYQDVITYGDSQNILALQSITSIGGGIQYTSKQLDLIFKNGNSNYADGSLSNESLGLGNDAKYVEGSATPAYTAGLGGTNVWATYEIEKGKKVILLVDLSKKTQNYKQVYSNSLMSDIKQRTNVMSYNKADYANNIQQLGMLYALLGTTNSDGGFVETNATQIKNLETLNGAYTCKAIPSKDYAGNKYWKFMIKTPEGNKFEEIPNDGGTVFPDAESINRTMGKIYERINSDPNWIPQGTNLNKGQKEYYRRSN